jgi:transcriptional regulator with XRE-family HTH domain
LTGKQLADLVGMSQPKISRIENGVGSAPSPVDVARLAEVLGAGPELSELLVEQARRAHESVGDWEGTVHDFELRQRETEHLEQSAVEFKVFQPTVIVGLLQTSGYAEAVLAAMQKLARSAPQTDVHGAVSARIHRQRALSDRQKRFDFVMSEAVLSNRVCAPEEMPPQIRRIRDVARQPNVTVSLIPANVRWRTPPFHGFALLDDQHLFVDLFDTGLAKHDEPEVAFYANIFATMKEQATRDIDPILDRYYRLYVGELSGS